ncbi:hypothetical protein [uncultured Thiodictyon sp.]|uniref:hypothetical protein n=1 Tax=uncultured Thiodictyon sp. TaxID=1846217 RepID=UPI0025F45E02|nr:hypothetical protein [uncultured Thiodictyon sp.]
MAAQAVVRNFQAAILAIAAARLGRPLSDKEHAFVTRREGLIALESIHDVVSTLSGLQLEQYLNSE